MPARLEGYLTVDVSDYQDEIEIHADADDIAEIMENNNVPIEEMIEYFDHIQDVNLATVENYITDVCDHDDLMKIVNCCLERFRADYRATFNQMCDNQSKYEQAVAENKVLTGGPNVSEIRSSC